MLIPRRPVPAASRSARQGASDSASFDEVLELLHLCGRSLPHAVLMMIPEAWENNTEMDPARREFYEFHASLMEPWDGPACVTFTDGTVIGAVLDRNGLRPARWWRTADDRVVLASEAGVLDVDPAEVVAKGRLQPGRMFLVDTAAGRIVERRRDQGPAGRGRSRTGTGWHAGLVHAGRAAAPGTTPHPRHEDTLRRQQIFGYTEEELRLLLAPMAATGAEAIGSMGTDTPVAVLSQRPRLLFDYFSQLFAQVTNPPLDAIREEMVTSLACTIGPDANLLSRGAGGVPTRSCCRSRCWTTTSWPRSAASTPTATCPASAHRLAACTRWTAAATRWPRRSSGCGPRSSAAIEARRPDRAALRPRQRRASRRRSRRCC